MDDMHLKLLHLKSYQYISVSKSTDEMENSITDPEGLRM